jgi:hypothetical protein
VAAVDYITLAELKTRMEVGDTSYDTVAPPLITAASSLLNEYLQRQVTPQETTNHTFDFGPGEYVVDLAPWDLRSATEVRLHPEATDGGQVLVSGTDYVLGPVELERDAAVYEEVRLSYFLVPVSDRLWRFGAMQLKVTGDWGFAAVPDGLKQACTAAVRSWLRRDYPTSGYAMDAPRDVQPTTPQSTADLPLAAVRLANAWRRAPGVV